MSERTVVGQEYFLKVKRPSPDNLQHQYSRDELLTLSKSPASVRRPKCLEPAYYSEDGKWDPEKWYRAKFCLARDASPLTLGDGKEQRKVSERDRDFRKKPSVNDSVERPKEERDGIVLGPQRRSFGTGCHVQSTSHQYPRQLGLHDREDSRGDRDRERERDREKPVRKVGSGRIQIEREASLRDSFDDRDHSRDHERERDFNWSRERDRDGRERDMWDSGWDRDVRDRELRSSDRDGRRFERSDRFRGVADRDNTDRDWRDREFRDRGFDKHSRRRNNRGEEKEPEWFTGGPTSQNDTIELRGFDREENNGDEGSARKVDQRGETKPRVTANDDRSIKADVRVSQLSSPQEDQPVLQQEQPKVTNQKPQEEESMSTPQQSSRASPNNKLFDFEEILSAILPVDENGVRQRSRFSRFFSGPGGNVLPCDISLENMLDPCDGGYPGRAVPSPTSMVGPMGAMQHAHRGTLQFQGQDGEYSKPHTFTHPNNLISMPNSAGDNNATAGKTSLPPSVTALFNRATLGGVSVCKWNPRLDCSVDTQESSLLTNSAFSSSSSSSFNTQDAEAQLKAMLFGGNRDSTSSSGTASPASLPPGAQRRAKTVAELEADMHSFSPQKYGIPVAPVESIVNPTNSGDVAAFNKLLIMLNAASEANQNMIQADHHAPHTPRAGYGMVPSHDEFNHAVMRNKEKQIQLQQQSLQNVQRPAPPLTGLPPQLHHQVLHQHMPPPPPTSHDQQLTHQLTQSALYQHYQKQQQMAMNSQKQFADMMNNKPPGSPGIPQAMSTPQPNAAMKMRIQNGGSVVSADPILSLIQQNPKIVMNPASPAPHMATIMSSQQSAAVNTARVPSPLNFNQQPPLHLSAPSPIHPGQLSPQSISMGRNLSPSAMSSPTGMRSPVLPRVLSPQELSAHAQAVMQSALIKKQLQDQSERYLKKQQERAKSPGLQQINVVKPPPAAQPVLPPTPQPKGASVDTFTPTSVLRKMHSDKALEKEKQAVESRKDGETEYMPSMHELSTAGEHADRLDAHSQDDLYQKADAKLRGDFSDISFLDPVNPNLVAMTNQLDNQLRASQTNILPGSLSQPMSVEEKMKLSALAEKPGYLSHMLDKAAAAETARGIHGRPVIRNDDQLQEERNVQQYLLAMQQQPPQNQSVRPVPSSGPKMQMPVQNPVSVQTSMAQYSGLQQNSMSKPMAGRAIVGGSCGFQQSQVPSASPAQNMDILRFFEQQHLQQQQQQHMRRLQQVSDCQGMVLPPPPLGTPLACLGPPPVQGRIQLVGQPPNQASSAALMHQHIARANAITAHRNQQLPHLMSMQHHNMAPLPPLHTVMTGVSVHLSPHSQTAGPLSPAALSATIQRIASPHGTYKMNGPLQPSGNSGGVPKVDLTSGIQRWFSPDILRTQLPSMPPLPTQGSQVITVDELERN